MSPSILPEPPLKDVWEVLDPSFSPAVVWTSERTVIIKQAARRRVFRQDDLYIKAFRIGGGVMRLRDPGRKEWTLAKTLHQRGLTAPPVAYGRSRSWSYFIARKIDGEDMHALLEFTWPTLGPGERQRIISAFCRLLFGISEAGLFQPDFHLNNCLFDHARRRFFLIDLHRAELAPGPLPEERRLEQLSYVLPPLWGKISSQDMLRAVSVLAGNWPPLRSQATRFSVQEKAFARMRRHWSSKGIIRTERNQEVLRQGRRRLIFTSGTPFPVRHFLEDNSLREIERRGTCLKKSRHTLTFRMDIGGQTFFIKLYRCSGALHRTSYLIRSSRSFRAWRVSWELITRGVPTPAPIAALSTGNPWQPLYGAVVYAWEPLIAGSIEDIKRKLGDPTEASSFVKQISGFVWEMHEKGIFHGDCKATNFVFRAGTTVPFAIYDLDGTRILKSVSTKERIRDLAALCASLEWWNLRSYVTSEVFEGYLGRHVPWVAERNAILARLQRRVEKRLARRETRTRRPEGPE